MWIRYVKVLMERLLFTGSKAFMASIIVIKNSMLRFYVFFMTDARLFSCISFFDILLRSLVIQLWQLYYDLCLQFCLASNQKVHSKSDVISAFKLTHRLLDNPRPTDGVCNRYLSCNIRSEEAFCQCISSVFYLVTV